MTTDTGVRLDVFVKGANSTLYHAFIDKGQGKLSNFDNIGGSKILVFEPAATRYHDGKSMMVFGVGSDSDLWAKRYNDQWSDWESLGGTWMGSPVPVTYDPQSVAAYLIAPDRSVWSNYFQQGSWKKKPLGGWFPNDTLTATSWRPSQDIFAVGKDGDLQHKWHYSRWSEWNSLGGTIYGRPKVITPQRNRLDVFAKGKDSKLYQKTFIGEAWTEWIDLGETHHYDPEAVSLTPDRIDLFSVGTDSQLMHSYCVDASDKEVGHFTPWEKLGGVCVGQPRAVMREGKTLDVFLKQSDSKLYRKFFDGSSWQPSSGFEDLDISPIGNTVT